MKRSLLLLGAVLALANTSAASAAPPPDEPDNPAKWTAAEAQLHLIIAEKYEQLADRMQVYILQENGTDAEQRKGLMSRHRAVLLRAAREYQDLFRALEVNEKAAAAFTPKERKTIRGKAADCALLAGHFEEARDFYVRTAANPTDDQEKLDALGGLLRCSAVLGNKEEVQETVQKIRKELGKLEEPKRRQWEEWLNLATKPVGP
jgi:hypothetical protein